MTSDSVRQTRNRFAQNDLEAHERFKQHQFEKDDPFPSILPALLNSADIDDYVSATGMIYPFDPSNGKLKTASYEIDLLGRCLYWDDKGEPRIFELKKGDKFLLKKNSIAFVSPKTKFRIPNYIALRFNLRITHVHRGLLLGTGPLVDPGFEGRLVIPLHNLTTNDYEFLGGEGLIWIEFTKLNSPHGTSCRADRYSRQGKYVPFPEDKKNLGMEYYLHKAAPHDTIRSSIPDAIQDARRSAKQALTTVKTITAIGFLSAIALGFTLYDSFKQTASLVQDSTVYIKDARKELDDLKDEVKSLRQEIQNLKKRPAQPSR
jgi:deoxycytidine triphosphate deaminase/cell division protein FtsB